MEVELNEKKYIEALRYVNRIKSLTKPSELKIYAGINVFKGIEGQIVFHRFSFSHHGNVHYDPYLRFSENDNKNRKLINKFERKLTN
jgi:hypothetical protein